MTPWGGCDKYSCKEETDEEKEQSVEMIKQDSTCKHGNNNISIVNTAVFQTWVSDNLKMYEAFILV
jgi:hypothetical protein